MNIKPLVAAVSATVLGISGCASSSSHSGNSAALKTQAALTAQHGPSGSSGRLALSAYVVTGNEQPGYAVGGHPTYTSVSAFANAEGFSGSDIKRFTAEGFRGAALAHTAGTAGQGVSYVI